MKIKKDVLDEDCLTIMDDAIDEPGINVQPWKLLIVDDEEDVHQATRLALDDISFEGKGLQFLSAYSSKEAKEMIASGPDIALILLDVVMENRNAGFEVIEYLRDQLNNHITRIILRTAHPGYAPEDRVIVDYDINDYKAKTELTRKKLFTTVIASLRSYRLISSINTDRLEVRSQNESLRSHLLNDELENPDVFSPIITANPQMISLFRYVEVVAQSTRPVLITGETGVGKGVIAETIHNLSGRDGSFVSVNIAGLDDNLFSDTLFGHVKGAYTGAVSTRSGLIESAENGSLFLDEIGDLSAISQVKLLRLLQDNEYLPLGSDSTRLSSARIIMATNRDLSVLLKTGEFRADLYYRAGTHEITLPPLRDRQCDIPLLVKYFVKKAAAELGIITPKISVELIEILGRYDFPGNIRELEVLVFDAVSRTLSGTTMLDYLTGRIRDKLGDKFDHIPPMRNTVSLTFGYTGGFPTLKNVIDQTIDSAIKEAEGNQSIAAKLLGLSRQALNQRLKRRNDN